MANVKDADTVLHLLSAPDLVTLGALTRLLGKLGGLMIGRLSRELLAEIFEGDLRVDEDALVSFRAVLSASLSTSASPLSFTSSSEQPESHSRLLSNSAGDSSVTMGNRERTK